MAHRIRIIGLLRFSVLTPTYYSERFPTLDAIAAHIWSPERMALRFHLFEKLCLPSLTGQTDADFECIILTGERLPAAYRDRLADLLAPHPNLHLRAVGTDNHYQLLKDGYNSIDLGDATHKALFRLDDDDAVDRRFIARTRKRARGLLALQDARTPTIIAYNRGFYVRRDETGDNEIFDATERAPLSTGTTLLCPVDYHRNPYRYNHRALAQHYTTYSDISVPAFIRTIHGDNKSNPTQMGQTHKMAEPRIRKALDKNFNVSYPDLKAL
ncbi:glycosyltransferase [Marinibacterium sp. SX1]|uniref:glycosyltransferase n=1 Tax=Marinibacterium sp. SX1 TaxID=3388424 RepID=UPI003D174119